MYVMETNNEAQSLIDSNDIEARIIILKRRAAEADFLRQERDMLINRLKLYNPDYVWPDSGINKCLQMPTDKELDEIKRKNEQLISENEELLVKNKQLITINGNLKMDITVLQQKLENVNKSDKQIESLIQENIYLKENFDDVTILQNEKEQLLIDKKNLQEDLEKVMEMANAGSMGNCDKVFLQRLFFRLENVSKEKMNLQNSLYSKDIQIDLLNGKISHLNAQLNEPYIAAKIKLSMGKKLSDEEAYMWAAKNLEQTNTKMNCELQKVTEQLDVVTEKYLNIQQNLKTTKSFPQHKELQITPIFLNESLSLEDLLYEDQDHYPWDEEKGSTAPVTRDHSLESMHETITKESTVRKLHVLFNDAHEMERLNFKLMNLKQTLKQIETKKKSPRERFFSFAVIPFGESRPSMAVLPSAVSTVAPSFI